MAKWEAYLSRSSLPKSLDCNSIVKKRERENTRALLPDGLRSFRSRSLASETGGGTAAFPQICGKFPGI